MIHRRHLQAQRRDAGREMQHPWGPEGTSTSLSLAAYLVGQLTSPSQAAIREEQCQKLRESLDQLEEIDREVLALRHFEHLGNSEAAEVLGITPKAASNRYVRALKRLGTIVQSIPDLAANI